MSDSLRPHGLVRQALLSMRFPRQGYWSGMPFPSPGDLPNLEVKPRSLASSALAGGQYSVGKNNRYHAICIILFYSLLKYLINMVIILNLYFILRHKYFLLDIWQKLHIKEQKLIMNCLVVLQPYFSNFLLPNKFELYFILFRCYRLTSGSYFSLIAKPCTGCFKY